MRRPLTRSGVSWPGGHRQPGPHGRRLHRAAARRRRSPPPPGPIDIQILGLNDFHENLEPPAGSGGASRAPTPGSAAFLATHVAELEAAVRNTIVVSAEPHRRQPAAVGPLPRRADHRGDEPGRPRPQRRGAVRRGAGSWRIRRGGSTGSTAARTAPASRAPTSSSWRPTWSTSAPASRCSRRSASRRSSGAPRWPSSA